MGFYGVFFIFTRIICEMIHFLQMFTRRRQLLQIGLTLVRRQITTKAYTQGQVYKNERGKNVREYFYFIDHQGQVKAHLSISRLMPK